MTSNPSRRPAADIASLVSDVAARFGPRTALIEREGTRTFAELGEGVARIGRGLLAAGLSPGDRVVDLQLNTAAAVETGLAVRAAGLVHVALNPRLGARGWRDIVADARPRALLFGETFAGAVEAADLCLDLCINVPDSSVGLAALMAGQSADPLPTSDERAVCGLHYSSGTTGRPKGAKRTHLSWVASARSMTRFVLPDRVAESDVFVHAGPVMHTSGLFVLPFLLGGGRQLMLPRWDPELFVRAVRTYGGTHTVLVPTMLAKLLEGDALRDGPLTSLKMLAYAGAPIGQRLLHQVRAKVSENLVQYYGLVEAVPALTVLGVEDHRRAFIAGDTATLSSVGRPVDSVELKVVDPAGHDLPGREVGEIVVRGPQVMPGYWNEGTRDDLGKRLVDGWLHTGDVGRVLDNGCVQIVDRRDEMVISGGYNIYPREVEVIIEGLEGIDEVAVVGIPHEYWGQELVAYFSARPGSDLTAENVLAHCGSMLPDFKRPRRAVALPRLPHTAIGKIAKRSLPDAARETSPHSYVDPPMVGG